MGQPINIKCQECAKLTRKQIRENPPECYNDGKRCCSRRRYHYRHLQRNRDRMNAKHRYLRFKADKCFICNSTDSLECHHIIAQTKGGKDNQENVITLCHSCHRGVESYEQALEWKGFTITKLLSDVQL